MNRSMCRPKAVQFKTRAKKMSFSVISLTNQSSKEVCGWEGAAGALPTPPLFLATGSGLMCQEEMI